MMRVYVIYLLHVLKTKTGVLKKIFHKLYNYNNVAIFVIVKLT